MLEEHSSQLVVLVGMEVLHTEEVRQPHLAMEDLPYSALDVEDSQSQRYSMVQDLPSSGSVVLEKS